MNKVVDSKKQKSIFPELISSIKAASGQHNGFPSVTLSYAQSLDGSIAIGRGEPVALSSSESQILTHELRANHDAVLVGIETVLSDDPFLTVRLAEGRDPLPVVLDSKLRLPLKSNLLKNKLPPLVAATTSASEAAQRELERSGAKVVRTVPDKRGWVELRPLLRQLSDLGIKNVMVEGGARVITSFLDQHLVDCIVITISPTLLGGLHAIESPLVSWRSDGRGRNCPLEFETVTYQQLGKDIIFWAELSRVNR